MTKWADYLISCVNYTADKAQIATAGVHVDDTTGVGTKQTWHRQQIVDKMAAGKTFMTIVQNSAGQWTKGASVQRYPVGGTWFIKTEANTKTEDNLGNLPKC